MTQQVQIKQMKQILATVNIPKWEPVMVKCVAAHNEEDLIVANLKNNYDEYDIIRVVEGAVEGRPESTVDGHSSDNTLKLIRDFPDPKGKIELYTASRFFKSLEEQKQTFLDAAKSSSEVLCIVDTDEFYHEGDIDRIRLGFKTKQEALEIIPTFIHAFRDIWHIRKYHAEWNLWHQRCIRYQHGLRYHTHPVATDIQGKCTYFHPEYQSRRFIVPELYIYHYGHARNPDFFERKRKFYESELEKFKLSDGMDAYQKFDEKMREFVERTESNSEVLVYDGLHPKPIEDLPLHDYKDKLYDDSKYKHYTEVPPYNGKIMPTIPQLMYFTQQMPPVYNVIGV